MVFLQASHIAKVLLGVVKFVSEPWRGHISRKHVTEQCGVFDKVLPGDVLLADCVFDIAESVGMMQERVTSLQSRKERISCLP